VLSHSSHFFCLETTVRIQGAHPTCTQEKCEWIIPSYLKNAEYLPLRNIDFTSAQEKLDVAIDQDGHVGTSMPCVTARGEESSDAEMATLFASLSLGSTKPLPNTQMTMYQRLP